jgi:hypothetical protein
MKEWFETDDVFCMVTEFAQGQLFEIMEVGQKQTLFSAPPSSVFVLSYVFPSFPNAACLPACLHGS